MSRSCSRCRDKKPTEGSFAAAPARRDRPSRFAAGNQARLRTAAAPACCADCEEHERAEHALPGRNQMAPTPPRPASVDVWGLPVTRAMCGCRSDITSGIAWANQAARTYTACNVPANATATDVEACFAAAHPTAVAVASTDASGVISMPPPSADPCGQINDKAVRVHETMHARHADTMARAQGAAFLREWQARAGTPDRLDKMRARFPAEVAAFERQWDSGSDFASDEVHSYTWHRRFLVDALHALDRICP